MIIPSHLLALIIAYISKKDTQGIKKRYKRACFFVTTMLHLKYPKKIQDLAEREVMCVNPNKLRAVMALHGDSGVDLAKFLNISKQAFYSKINGRDGREFTQSEIQKIKERYSLTPEEVDDIFFEQLVS